MYKPLAEIRLDRLKSNYQFLQGLVGESCIMAVVKADAYGHGLPEVAATLEETGIHGFCVALGTEVEELLSAGITRPILHMGRIHRQVFELGHHSQVRLTVNDINDLDTIHGLARADQEITVHMKVDTGMRRMGIPYSCADKMIEKFSRYPNIRLEGVWSHLATAEEADRTFLKKQLEKFENLVRRVKKRLPEVKYFHLANSAALLTSPETHFNMVRPGLALFGVSPLGKPHGDLQPVMNFKAPVVLIKSVNAGESVGYSRLYTASKPGKIAILQAGYADGVPAEFCTRGYVCKNETAVPILGKVAMDMTAVSADILPLKEEDMLSFWGNGLKGNRVETLAAIYNRLPYEYLTGVSKRVERVYTGNP